MSNQKSSIDPETVLVTLDQITQTIEVLSTVVTRLQRYVQTHVPPFDETKYLANKPLTNLLDDLAI